jgi:hypothetical protein
VGWPQGPQGTPPGGHSRLVQEPTLSHQLPATLLSIPAAVQLLQPLLHQLERAVRSLQADQRGCAQQHWAEWTGVSALVSGEQSIPPFRCALYPRSVDPLCRPVPPWIVQTLTQWRWVVVCRSQCALSRLDLSR